MLQFQVAKCLTISILIQKGATKENKWLHCVSIVMDELRKTAKV